jgi:hypothetical protein
LVHAKATTDTTHTIKTESINNLALSPLIGSSLSLGAFKASAQTVISFDSLTGTGNDLKAQHQPLFPVPTAVRRVPLGSV